MMQKIPYILGIAGRSGSGKSTLAKKLKEHWKEKATHVDIDRFFWSSAELNCASPSEKETEALEKIGQELEKLKVGKTASFTRFDCHHQQKSQKPPKSYGPLEIIIVEGTLVLWSEVIRKTLDLKILVDVPDKICMERRVERHLNRLSDSSTDQERENLKRQVLNRWELIARQWDNYLDFDSKKHAEIVISNRDEELEKIISIVEKDCLL